jgi:inner membrane protein
MLIAHAPISYLANEIIQKEKIAKLKSNDQILVVLFSLLFGLLPDFDLFILTLLDLPGFIHHNIISHAPLFYIAIWAVLKILVTPIYNLLNKKTAKIIDKNLLNILVNTFLIATLFHLIADLLYSSIMIFYPFSNFKFFIFQYLLEPNLFAGYFFTPLMGIELVIIGVFLLAIYRRFLNRGKFIDISLKILTCIFIIYLPLTIYTSINTYNRTYMYDKGKKINWDIDYDMQIDSMDMNVGNTKESNIQKAKDIYVLDSTLDIVNSKKWSTNHTNSMISSVKYAVGGFNSFRIVSQAYYNIRLPIEPVLKDFSIKKDGFNSYRYDYDYPNLLYEYLSNENLLIELNLESPVNIPFGKIFFLMDEKNEVLNLGITLEGNYLATVLPEDTHLGMHSYTQIREYYKTEAKKIYIQK